MKLREGIYEVSLTGNNGAYTAEFAINGERIGRFPAETRVDALMKLDAFIMKNVDDLLNLTFSLQELKSEVQNENHL